MFSTHRMQSLRAPWMAWWLAMALVLAPALGRMHEVLHAPSGVAAHAQLTPTFSDPSSDDVFDHHGLAAWFNGHDALDCLTLDQLCLGHAGPGTLAAPVHLLPHEQPQWHPSASPRPQRSAVFLARAPPERFMG